MNILFKKIAIAMTLISGLQAVEEKDAKRSPIGDNIHSEVYTFIMDELLKEKSYSPEEVSRMIDQERQRMESHSTDKPFVAEIYEGEISSLLRILCRDYSKCHQITLYQRNGVGIADSGPMTELKFKEKQDSALNFGFLGLNLTGIVGVKTFIGNDGGTYHEIIKAIYYDKGNNYAYLSTDLPPNDHQLIGYIRYIVG